MKKIIIVVGLMLPVLSAIGQGRSGSTEKVLTIEEAKRLNGSSEPTINGKPYSQFKAEQDAQKSRQAAAEASRQSMAKAGNDGSAEPQVVAKSKDLNAGGLFGDASMAAKVTADPSLKQSPANVTAPASAPGKSDMEKVTVTESSTVSADAKVNPVTKQAPVLNDIIAQKSGTNGNGINGQPAAAPAKPKATTVEGGGNPVVPSATVKVTPSAAVSGPAPVPPVAISEMPATGSNSTGATTEKPAPAPAPKTKSEQAPDAPVQETKTRQGL